MKNIGAKNLHRVSRFILVNVPAKVICYESWILHQYYYSVFTHLISLISTVKFVANQVPSKIFHVTFSQVEELKAGGRHIPVTNSNKIEYIHLIADYKLNKQVRLT